MPRPRKSHEAVMTQDTLAHHLRVVAAHYETNAKDKALSNQPRLKEQFQRQQAECLRMATALQNADDIRTDGDRLIAVVASREST